MRYAFDIPKFLEWVVKTWVPVRLQADQAAYSRSHFSRMFSREVGESPGGLRRRLRLEAAAHLLTKSPFQIGEVAVEVGYETPEAFNKAFRRAYGASPRAFRMSTPGSTWLPSASGIHFHPAGLIVRRQGETNMKLNRILFEQHLDEVTRLLDEMSKLTDEQIDASTIAFSDAIPWDKHGKTLRQALKSIVGTHLIWLAAFKGEPLPELISDKATLDELKLRHAESGPALLEFVKEVEEKDLWASEFVDALCEEPARFVFGAVLAHILVFGIHRRMLALAALRSLGVKGLEYGDPINWLRAKNGEEMYGPECA